MSSIYDKSSLVLIPSGTKTSKVYSQKPTNGDGDFTFSRSTAATRVNASGNIEKETQNLLLQSNSFNTTWLDITLTKTSGQAGYDGTNDAWKLDCNAASSRLYQTSLSVSNVQTFSVYAKAGTLNYMGLIVAGAGAYAYFDIANGQLGATNVGTIDHKIESIGGGWYRCSIAYTGTTTAVRIYPAQGDNDTAQTSGNIYIQDAQLEQGLVARDVITTTTTAIYGGITDNVPRLDYQGSCPALLLEPQRRNILPHSEWFGDYNTLNGASITSNYSESPEGYQNATRLQLNAQSLSRIEYAVATGSPVQNERHSVSCWVKSNGGDTDFRLKCTHAGVLDYHSSNLTATSEWQRFTFTQLFGAGGGTTITAGILNGSSNNAADLSIYGLQLEDDGAGGGSSYATSYIPTYGSAVTRNKDSVSLYNQDDLFGDGQGTWAIDINLDSRLFYNYSILGSYPNYIGVNVSTTYMDMEIIDNAVLTGQVRYNNSSTGRFKIAIAYDGNSALFYVNGTKVGEDTSVTIPSVNDIFLRNNEANANAFRYNQALLFPTKLTEEELATLTTI